MPASRSSAPHGEGDQEYLGADFAGAWTPGARCGALRMLICAFQPGVSAALGTT